VKLGDWEGLCYNFTERVCLNDAASTSKKCVSDLESCLLYYSSSTPADGTILGVLGLGRPSINQYDQVDSWVQ